MPILGVVGTMVWDTIWRQSGVRSPIEEWGGISYALAAADAVAPRDYQVRPLVKLGRDLAERGHRFLQELSVIETGATLAVVDAPNPRVELRYTSGQRRSEWLRGGVPPWTWAELAPRIAGCEALYVNFITGNEFDLEVAQQVRRAFGGPIYADMHSLLLATGVGGRRYRCSLDRWSEWLRCFDVVQLNEDELRAISAHWGDPWEFAAGVVGRQPELLFVTLGPNGAAYVMAADALPLGRAGRSRAGSRVTLRTGRIAVVAAEGGDPTGCGDVWGMTVLRALLAGRDVESAMQLANAAASRSVAHRGASGLNRFLRGEIELA